MRHLSVQKEPPHSGNGAGEWFPFSILLNQHRLVPLSDSKETNAGVICQNGKAHGGSGAGTMTEAKRSHFGKAPGFHRNAKHKLNQNFKSNIRLF
jgi:hypothetical protein